MEWVQECPLLKNAALLDFLRENNGAASVSLIEESVRDKYIDGSDIVCYDFIRAEYLSVDPAQMLPQYKKQGSDQWLRNGTLRYPEWKFEQAGFVYDKEKLPHGELKYENIDYLSISI